MQENPNDTCGASRNDVPESRLTPGPNNLRRPRWYARPYKPAPEMFALAKEGPQEALTPAD
jgi:hypothetical protein